MEHSKTVGLFGYGIGSDVSIDSKYKEINGPSIFLGKTIFPDGTESDQMYLNKKSKVIHYIESNRINKSARLQTVLSPYEQAGGTCTGYAMYDFLQQLQLSGFVGTGELDRSLIDERARTYLLVDNINEYYLTPRHQYSIRRVLKKYGKSFGFTCKEFSTENYQLMKEKVLAHLETGIPLIIEFYTGEDMVNSPFALNRFRQSKRNQLPMDERLWIPRKNGEKKSDGHSIVIAGSFEDEGKTYLVMIDSDWAEPRIWDMDAFLNDKKTALDEVIVTTCQ
ncbi:MAG: hypothetical protein H7Z71_01995 [Moraxellaceae bacterium]|nr:hypothetical protein [Pseudobdellovibrionaceae bacterium]